MSSTYHEQPSSNKHHYKSHRETNSKNKFVIYVEKKSVQSNPSGQDPKSEPRQEEISKEKQKHLMEKALESYEKYQEKTSDFQNKERKNSQNYPKKRNQRSDGNQRSTSYHWSTEDKGYSHHQFFNEGLRRGSNREIPKERILKEYEKVVKMEPNEKIKEFAKNYSDCFSMELFSPENNSDVKYDIKDAFSRNVNSTSNQQENHSGPGRHSNSHYNKNQEETRPAWADYDINDPSFKNFEFRTIEKPDRPKREEHKALVENSPIHEEPKLEEDYDEFHDHIDCLMEERLKDKREGVDKDEFEQNGVEDENVEKEAQPPPQPKIEQKEEEVKPSWDNDNDEPIKEGSFDAFAELIHKQVATPLISQPRPPDRFNAHLFQGISAPPNLPQIMIPRQQITQEEFESSFINLYPFGQDHTTINLFSIFMQKIPGGNTSESVWYYKDPQGDTQGPFNSINMDCWNMDKYFPLHLPIAWNQTVQFVTIEYFKNYPISLVNLAHRYGGLSRYIRDYNPTNPSGPKNMSTSSAKLPNNPMANMGNMQSLQGVGIPMMNTQGNIFNKIQISNYGNLTNIPLNMNPMGGFNNMGNIGNINNLMNINTMNLQANAKFQNAQQINQMGFKGGDESTLTQLLRLVDNNKQINLRGMVPGNPNFGLENVANFQQQVPQQNILMQNLNPALMVNLMNNPGNNNGQAMNLASNQVPQNQNPQAMMTNVNNLNNMAFLQQTNFGPVNSVNLPSSDSQKNISPPPQNTQTQTQQPQPPLNPKIEKIDTMNLKMMLGLSNPGQFMGSAPNTEQISQKEKEKREREQFQRQKEQEMIEKRNAEFPSLSEAMAKKH